MQIKKQLRIELNQVDITEAIADFLLKHNQSFSQSELDEIKFTNSAKEGIRANLNILEETDTESQAEEVDVSVGTTSNKTTLAADPVNAGDQTYPAAQSNEAQVTAEPEGVNNTEPEPEPAGEVAVNSVEEQVVAEEAPVTNNTSLFK